MTDVQKPDTAPTEPRKRKALIRIVPEQTAGQLTDVAAEKAIIGSVIANPDMLAVVTELQPADFGSRRNAFLWHTMLKLDNANQTFDIVTLPERYMQHDYARRHDSLDAVTKHVHECLATAATDRDTIYQYARSVMDSAVRIRSIQAQKEITELLRDKSIPVDQALSQADHLWHEATELKDAKPPTMTAAAQDFQRRREKIQAGDRKIIETGLAEFDSWAGGLVTDQITLIGGYTGEGKTTLMLDILLSLAQRGEPVVLFVDEQSTFDIMRKLVAKLTGIASRRMLRPMSESENQRVNGALQVFDELPLYIFDSVRLQPAAIIRAVRRLERQFGSIAGVFVDGIYIMQDDGGGESPTWVAHEKIMNKLLGWIQDSGKALVMTHQLEGDNYGTAKQPSNYMLRGGQVIVQRTETIYILHRPYNDPDTTRFLCTKNREKGHIAGTDIELHWHPAGESYFDFQKKYIPF